MKHNENILKIAFVLSCLAVSVSCGKLTNCVKAGDEIAFSGYTEGSEITKATYKEGEYAEGDIQPIYWSEGDLLRVTCAQAVGAQSADYVVKEVKESDKRQAKISLYLKDGEKVGLRWGENPSTLYKFFAAYPSPKCEGSCREINGYYIKGFIPQNGNQNTLDGALSESNGNYTLTPDLKWQLMVANSEYLQRDFPETGTAFLQFKPLTTAIQFTITNSVATDLVIKELHLLADSTRISGRFDIDNLTSLASDGFPNMRLLADAYTGQTAKIVLASDVTIKQGKTFTFTFFLVPVKDIRDLRFRIVRGGDNAGATLTTRLGYTDGTGINFSRCKKSFVKGIMVPEGVQWTIDYEPVLTDWINDGGKDLNLN